MEIRFRFDVEHQNCEDCVFWRKRRSEDDAEGTCHRYPPRMMENAAEAVFPQTWAGDTCGEGVNKRKLRTP